MSSIKIRIDSRSLLPVFCEELRNRLTDTGTLLDQEELSSYIEAIEFHSGWSPDDSVHITSQMARASTAERSERPSSPSWPRVSEATSGIYVVLRTRPPLSLVLASNGCLQGADGRTDLLLGLDTESAWYRLSATMPRILERSDISAVPDNLSSSYRLALELRFFEVALQHNGTLIEFARYRRILASTLQPLTARFDVKSSISSDNSALIFQLVESGVGLGPSLEGLADRSSLIRETLRHQGAPSTEPQRIGNAGGLGTKGDGNTIGGIRTDKHFFVLGGPILDLPDDYQLTLWGDGSNTPPDRTNLHWPSIFTQGQTFGATLYPYWEWMPILSGTQFDSRPEQQVAVAGTVVAAGMSGGDLRAAHPFMTDFEFFIAPDPPYEQLMAPGNFNKRNWFGGPDFAIFNTDPEYQDAYDAAQAMGLDVEGTVGVETDQGLLPQLFRPQLGDRVVVFGRWIVDAGHADYHAEIHPPLMVVCGRRSEDDPNVTECFLCVRPCTPSQLFHDQDGNAVPFYSAIFNQVQTQLVSHFWSPANSPKQVAATQDLLLPPVDPTLNKPIKMSFVFRHADPRKDAKDSLLASFKFIANSHAYAYIFGDGDSVRIDVTLDPQIQTQRLQEWQQGWTAVEDVSEATGDLPQNFNSALQAFSDSLRYSSDVGKGPKTADFFDQIRALGLKITWVTPWGWPIARDLGGGPQDVDVNELVTGDPGQPEAYEEQYQAGIDLYDSADFPVIGRISLRWKRA